MEQNIENQPKCRFAKLHLNVENGSAQLNLQAKASITAH
jgi:hypothetical protein